ncbi:MAG TPA: pyridoxamine 5'-phosphate oxidase family protein [Xanthobacteraceae bacterium]|jgi:PPOX class probable FMN-dependent enzyme|nr:pyridoxamine 5'-phosphate oxidase family protein [Xanthobacteraceae bacterium]
MDRNGHDHTITTAAELEKLYSDAPYGPAVFKETDRITPQYRKLIEAAPFCVVATCGPEGLDCSPRGDPPGFIRVLDAHTLVVPDRRGNNRIDSLRNLVRDPRISLLFLIPGVGETMRVNGRAVISTDPKLTQSFAMNGKVPKCVLVVTVERAYFQCTKAIIRSKLWDPASIVDRKSLPTPGSILAELTDGKMGGPEHDRAAPERIKQTIY